MILSLLFILNAVNAQTLSWNKPEPRKNEQGVVISSEPTGYRILYEIQREHNKCLQYVGIRPKYSLDLGATYKYDLQEDINFQKGMTYYIAVVSYTIQPITENEKDVGYRVIESPATSHACVVIRGIPSEVEFEGVYNEEYINNYNEGEENEEIIIASASVPSADSASRDGTLHGTTQRDGHERSGVNGADHSNKNLLGVRGRSIRPSDSDRTAAANAYFSRRDNGHNDLAVQRIKTRVDNGQSLLLPSDSIERTGDRGLVRVAKINTDSVQADSKEPKSADKFNSSIIFLIAGATICGACFVKG